jgi:hypothetical protein
LASYYTFKQRAAQKNKLSRNSENQWGSCFFEARDGGGWFDLDFLAAEQRRRHP